MARSVVATAGSAAVVAVNDQASGATRSAAEQGQDHVVQGQAALQGQTKILQCVIEVSRLHFKHVCFSLGPLAFGLTCFLARLLVSVAFAFGLSCVWIRLRLGPFVAFGSDTNYSRGPVLHVASSMGASGNPGCAGLISRM